MTTKMNKTAWARLELALEIARDADRTPAARTRHATYTAPAHSAEGQSCAQCGEPAWHTAHVPFCRDHDQSTWMRANA